MNQELLRGSQRVKKTGLGPWSDVATARSFLAFLAGYRLDTDIFADNLVDEKQLAAWLVEHGLGPLAYACCQDPYPILANLLQHDRYSCVAENSIHQQNMEQVTIAFSQANIPAVLLKGAALAEMVDGGWERRTMSDVDIWLQEPDFAQSYQTMRELGFITTEKEDRPRALQMMSNGELQYYRRDLNNSLVELHLSPYAGWWLKRTAAIDKRAIWSRVEPIGHRESLYHLSPEDSVIHIAVHMAINHQCGYMGVRSLLDIAQTAISGPINWKTVVDRAKQWRVSAALWLVLYLLQQLVGTPGLDEPLQHLRPSFWRRRYLQQLVSPESILLGNDLSVGRIRFLYLLLLVDRKRDMSRLVFRTIWPEEDWLSARYGKSVGHGRHLVNILRYGQP